MLNNYKKNIIKYFVVLFCLTTLNLGAQDKSSIDYNSPEKFEIGGIVVNGAENLNNNTLIAISGISVGDEIAIPGEKISSAVKKLWQQGLFSDVDISIDKIVGNIVFLQINLVENARLSKFKFKGNIKKSEITSLKEDIKLIRGKTLTQNLINNSMKFIKDFYINKGYFNVDVSYILINDTTTKNGKDLVFNIDKGEKIKIKNIIIKGRKKILNTNKTILNKKDSIYSLSNNDIKKSMKETKEKNFWRFWKVSKFIKSNYEDDKKNIIAKYNEIGYRDAKIIDDTVYKHDNKTVTIEITIDEGELYRFGNINFVGNTIYTSKELKDYLNISNGDLFDQSILNSRLFASADGTDLSSLYLDDGYLFFNATPFEISAVNNQIDLEIRIYEGKQAKVNKVSIKGNTKTNDHVIMRELRTNPGDLFKRSDIMRSQEN